MFINFFTVGLNVNIQSNSKQTYKHPSTINLQNVANEAIVDFNLTNKASSRNGNMDKAVRKIMGYLKDANDNRLSYEKKTGKVGHE